MMMKRTRQGSGRLVKVEGADGAEGSVHVCGNHSSGENGKQSGGSVEITTGFITRVCFLLCGWS